jgi:hypothetical protein
MAPHHEGGVLTRSRPLNEVIPRIVWFDTDMTTPPPPGWHPDPDGKPQLRWWDGQQWTAETQPHPSQPGPVGTPSPSGFDPKTRERNTPAFTSQSYPTREQGAHSTRNGFGITSLVLALIGVVFGLVPLTGFIALILGALAVLFGLLGFGRVRKGLATNKIMTLAGTGLGVVAVALGIWGMTIFFGAVDELDQKLDDLGGSASTVTGTAPTSSAEATPGSRENPLRPGQAITLPGWDITIHSTTQDATAAVLAENRFNDPPAAGRQFVMADVATTYTGTETGTPWIDLSFRILGSANNVFGSASADSCGVIPNALSDTGELYPEGSSRGNVCVSVPADQLIGANWIVKASFRGGEVFVSLQ